MTIKEKIMRFVKAQGNQVGSGAELGEILDEMVDSMPGPPGPQGPQGPQGNTGSSVDYPYELVNNLTTNDPEKGLSAAQGVVLKGEISQLGQEVDKINEHSFGVVLNLVDTLPEYILKEDGTTKHQGNFSIKKYDIPEGVTSLIFKGRTSIDSVYSVLWVVNSSGQKLYSIAGPGSLTDIGTIIDLSTLTNPTQIWISIGTYDIFYYLDSDLMLSTEILALKNNKSIINSDNIIDSLFAITKYRDSQLEQTGRLKEDGTIESTTNPISVIDLPSGVDRIYFTLSSTSSLAIGYSICWVVNADGVKLASIPARGGSGQTYIGVEIDLSGLTNPAQVWFSGAIYFDSYIQFYDYTNRVEKKIEDIEKDVKEIEVDIENLNINNHWKGKKIVWLGTSIPWGEDGGSRCAHPYPSQVCAALGATLVDSTHGGLAQQAYYDETNQMWCPKLQSGTTISFGSTSVTVAECLAAYQAGIVSANMGEYSYENSLLGKNADLYVFDVEPNNNDIGSTADLELFDWRLWKYTDNSSFASHRNTYIGALIYEIDQLLTEKPDAVVVFVGEYVGMHLNNYQNVPYPIRALSLSLCEKFHIHYIDLAEKLFYTGKNMSVWLNNDEIHPKQVLYNRIAKILINELLLIA